MMIIGGANQRRADARLLGLDDIPLQPLDGRRQAPDRKRMSIRSPDVAAQSVRAIGFEISRADLRGRKFSAPLFRRPLNSFVRP